MTEEPLPPPDLPENGNQASQEPQGGTQAALDRPVVLTVTWNPKDSSLNVDGPLHNKMLCYGLLESARDAIWEAFQQRRVQAIAEGIVPARNLPSGIRRR